MCSKKVSPAVFCIHLQVTFIGALVKPKKEQDSNVGHAERVPAGSLGTYILAFCHKSRKG